MDPRRWPGRRLALFAVFWPIFSLAAYLVASGRFMAASGPSGGLAGFSLGSLGPVAAIVLGPPVVALGLWLAGRASRTPPTG